MPVWKVKEKTVDEKGLATTKTINTENISVMQKLLETNEKKKGSNKPQQEPKKASKKKETTKIKQISLKAPEIKLPKQEAKKEVPRLKKATPKKLEPPKKKEVKALHEEPKKDIPIRRQKMKVELKCLELIKKDPKIKYCGYSDGEYTFSFYGHIYNFSSLPEAIKDFLNYEVWYEAGKVKTKKLSGKAKIQRPKKHPATTIKKIKSNGLGNQYEFYNKKGERVLIDISKITHNPKDKNNNPNLWVKAGYLKKPIYSYFSVDTYVYDEEGNCWGKYNPTRIKDKTNFQWILEPTPANEQKILKEIYRLANL